MEAQYYYQIPMGMLPQGAIWTLGTIPLMTTNHHPSPLLEIKPFAQATPFLWLKVWKSLTRTAAPWMRYMFK